MAHAPKRIALTTPINRARADNLLLITTGHPLEANSTHSIG